MRPEQIVLLVVVVSLVGMGVLYGVIRLAVQHAMRATLFWQHDGRFERELGVRRRFRGLPD